MCYKGTGKLKLHQLVNKPTLLTILLLVLDTEEATSNPPIFLKDCF
jgi:hypothetical protein